MKARNKLITAKEYVSICAVIVNSYLEVRNKKESEETLNEAKHFVNSLSHRLLRYTEEPSFYDETVEHSNHSLVQAAIEQLHGVSLYPERKKFTLGAKYKKVKSEVAGKVLQEMNTMKNNVGQQKMSDLISSKLSY
jgi:hypothetical protein